MIRIYDRTEREFKSLGIGVLKDAISCVVTEDISCAFELVMSYPVTGAHYDALIAENIIFCKPNPYDNEQAFRIYEVSKPIDGIVEVNAAHISYDLSNIAFDPPMDTDGVIIPFTDLNNAIDTIKGNALPSIEPWNITTDIHVDEDNSTEMMIDKPCSVRAVLLSNQGLSKAYGGTYKFDNFNVKLCNQRGIDRGFSIRYKKNMTGVEQKISNQTFYTSVFPYYYAAKQETRTEYVKVYQDIYILKDNSTEEEKTAGTFQWDMSLTLGGEKIDSAEKNMPVNIVNAADYDKSILEEDKDKQNIYIYTGQETIWLPASDIVFKKAVSVNYIKADVTGLLPNTVYYVKTKYTNQFDFLHCYFKDSNENHISEIVYEQGKISFTTPANCTQAIIQFEFNTGRNLNDLHQLWMIQDDCKIYYNLGKNCWKKVTLDDYPPVIGETRSTTVSIPTYVTLRPIKNLDVNDYSDSVKSSEPTSESTTATLEYTFKVEEGFTYKIQGLNKYVAPETPPTTEDTEPSRGGITDIIKNTTTNLKNTVGTKLKELFTTNTKKNYYDHVSYYLLDDNNQELYKYEHADELDAFKSNYNAITIPKAANENDPKVSKVRVIWERHKDLLEDIIKKFVFESDTKLVITYVDNTVSKIMPVNEELSKYEYQKLLSLDLSREFSGDIPTSDQLKEAAEKYIKDYKIGEFKETIEVTFALLHNTNEYEDFKDLEHVELDDNVKVVHEDLKINSYLHVIKVEYNAITNTYEKITLGIKEESISDTALTAGDDISSLTNDKHYADETTVNKLIADTVSAKTLEAGNAQISKGTIDFLKTAKIECSGVIEASAFQIENLVAKSILAENATINKVLSAGEITVSGTINAMQGNIGGCTIEPTFKQAVDENGNKKYDENGDPIYVQKIDENYKPVVDDKGDPVYEPGEGHLVVSSANIDKLEAVDISASKITGTTIKATSLVLGEVTIKAPNGDRIETYDKDGNYITIYSVDKNAQKIYDENGNELIVYDKDGNIISIFDNNVDIHTNFELDEIGNIKSSGNMIVENLNVPTKFTVGSYDKTNADIKPVSIWVDREKQYKIDYTIDLLSDSRCTYNKENGDIYLTLFFKLSAFNMVQTTNVIKFEGVKTYIIPEMILYSTKGHRWVEIPNIVFDVKYEWFEKFGSNPAGNVKTFSYKRTYKGLLDKGIENFPYSLLPHQNSLFWVYSTKIENGEIVPDEFIPFKYGKTIADTLFVEAPEVTCKIDSNFCPDSTDIHLGDVFNVWNKVYIEKLASPYINKTSGEIDRTKVRVITFDDLWEVVRSIKGDGKFFETLS